MKSSLSPLQRLKLVAARGTRLPKHVTNAANPNRPEKGYFRPADPSAPVVAPGQLSRSKDFSKKGGRWEEEFIWNTNWQEQLKYEEDYKRQQEEEEKAKEAGEGGFLSLSRLGDLNDPNLDLSEQLRLAKERKEEEARQKAAREAARARRPRPGSQLPARFEIKRLERGSKFGTSVVAQSATNETDLEERREKARIEQERYEELKAELVRWTVGVTAICFGCVYAFYTRDTAASYGVGALGGYAYLRLLSRTVDSVGTGSVSGAIGQPRLLIPVVLVLLFNRWNTLRADEAGLHLELLPMLLGFFTYKVAVIGKNFTQLARDLVPKPVELSASSSGSPSGAEGSGEGGGKAAAADRAAAPGRADAARAALSVDRAFVRDVLKG